MGSNFIHCSHLPMWDQMAHNNFYITQKILHFVGSFSLRELIGYRCVQGGSESPQQRRNTFPHDSVHTVHVMSLGLNLRLYLCQHCTTFWHIVALTHVRWFPLAAQPSLTLSPCLFLSVDPFNPAIALSLPNPLALPLQLTPWLSLFQIHISDMCSQGEYSAAQREFVSSSKCTDDGSQLNFRGVKRLGAALVS